MFLKVLISWHQMYTTRVQIDVNPAFCTFQILSLQSLIWIRVQFSEMCDTQRDLLNWEQKKSTKDGLNNGEPNVTGASFKYRFLVLVHWNGPSKFATQVIFGGFRDSIHKKSIFTQMHISSFLNDDLLLSNHQNSHSIFYCHWLVLFICFVLIIDWLIS